jgi:hypothetical protein
VIKVHSFPFKGKVGMGIDPLRSTNCSFPFKGKVGMGMGNASRDILTHPHLVPPLVPPRGFPFGGKGEDEKSADE